MSLQAPVESDQQKKGRQPKPPKNEQVYEIQLSHEKKNLLLSIILVV